MTGPEHWREADLILSGDACEYGCPHSGCAHEMQPHRPRPGVRGTRPR